jgi:hypothetical protein
LPANDFTQARDEKVENLLINFSMLVMGMLEGAFATMASGMAEAMTGSAAAMADALGGPEASKSTRSPELKKAGTQVSAKIKETFAELRREVTADFTSDPKFKEFIRDPSFDEGVKIVESYDLGLPRLTEKLSDADLSAYTAKLTSGDKMFGEMMEELSKWQKRTPRLKREP